jgi:hypothetical protein
MKPAIKMKPVESSNIRAIGHDPTAPSLIVEFKSGDFYEYEGVSETKFAELEASESKGKFLIRHIKPNYACKKLDLKPEKGKCPKCGVLTPGSHFCSEAKS